MMSKIWAAMLSLTRTQIRSLYALAMLGGIVALSVEAWFLVAFASDAQGAWFGLILERLRIVSALTGLFALVVALTTFGADYFRAKYGDNEVEFGDREDGE